MSNHPRSWPPTPTPRLPLIAHVRRRQGEPRQDTSAASQHSDFMVYGLYSCETVSLLRIVRIASLNPHHDLSGKIFFFF